MASGPDDSGLKLLRWFVTVATAAALVIVVIRVSACLGDDLCTFAPGALQSAVMAFVGGPILVLTVWLVPGLTRRSSLPCWAGWIALGAAAVTVIVGFATLGGGGPAAAVIPSMAPALGIAGLLILAGGGFSPSG